MKALGKLGIDGRWCDGMLMAQPPAACSYIPQQLVAVAQAQPRILLEHERIDVVASERYRAYRPTAYNQHPHGVY